MTVHDLTEALGLVQFHIADPERAVTGGYCGDLLSWVMGRAPEGSAWVTIMNNVNVAAVAALTDVACVILAEGVAPDAALLARAQSRGINLLGTERSAYSCAGHLAERLK